MSVDYKIPIAVHRDLMDILIGIEIDLEAQTRLPKSMCKLLVSRILMDLADVVANQAELIARAENEKPETIN
jgi:hypothetical protein